MIKDALNIHGEKSSLNRYVGQELPPVILQFVTRDSGHVTQQ